MLRELLTDAPGVGRAGRTALRRGASAPAASPREVQAVLARAREKGLDPADLARARASASGVPEFVAAGLFLEQYLDDPRRPERHRLRRPDPPRGASRPTAHRDELRAAVPPRLRRRVPGHRPRPGRAAARARRRRPRPHRRRRPAPVDLRLPRRRGARHPRLPARRSRSADGAPAPTWSRCGTTRRFGPRLLPRLAARRRPRSALTGAIDADARARRSVSPTAAPATLGDGRVEVLTFDTERAEAEHLADLLRRAHLEDGVAVVRDGGAGPLRPRHDPARCAARSARPACPVEVASDDTPLVREPAVLPLLDALRAVVNLDNDDRRPRRLRRPRPRRGAAARPARRARRQRRAPPRAAAARPREGARAHAEARLPLTSARAGPRARCSTTASSTGSTGPRPPPRRARCTLLVAGDGRRPRRRRHRRGGALGAVVRHRLARPAAPRGRARRGQRARRAHRDLDAICALFEAAARAEEQRGHTGVRELPATLRAQQIPADTLAERGVRGDAVRLLTAHRSKGLEWRLVVVAHVQEEALARPAPPRHRCCRPTGSAATACCRR